MAPSQRPIDFYDILSVDSDATIDEIRTAYRARIAQYHPDRNRDPHATAVAALINEAWETLRDPVRRRVYDERLGSAADRDASNPSDNGEGAGESPREEPTPTESSAEPPQMATETSATVSTGWKLYLLAWVWLGMAAGYIGGASAALTIWLVGATFGWSIAGVVRRRGWGVVGKWTVVGASVLVLGLYALVRATSPANQQWPIGDGLAGAAMWALIICFRRSPLRNAPISARRIRRGLANVSITITAIVASIVCLTLLADRPPTWVGVAIAGSVAAGSWIVVLRRVLNWLWASSPSTPEAWQCPSCARHVPARIDLCRCGFRRAAATAGTA